jgi:hypothetical protein
VDPRKAPAETIPLRAIGCLDDGFHETGINEASEHGTGRMLVDSWFQNI